MQFKLKFYSTRQKSLQHIIIIIRKCIIEKNQHVTVKSEAWHYITLHNYRKSAGETFVRKVRFTVVPQGKSLIILNPANVGAERTST